MRAPLLLLAVGCLLLGGCALQQAPANFSVADWTMPALGEDRPVTWIIETPATITANAIERGLPADTRAYVRYGYFFNIPVCVMTTPPLNDVSVIDLIRREIAHCIFGPYHE